VAVARWRQGEDPCDIGLELRLVVLDDHDIIAPSLHQRLCHLSLGEQGIHRHDAVRQYDLGSYGLDLFALMGFG
jgi:hypothetical protein